MTPPDVPAGEIEIIEVLRSIHPALPDDALLSIDLRDLDSLSLVELLAIAEGECDLDGTDFFFSCSTPAELIAAMRRASTMS